MQAERTEVGVAHRIRVEFDNKSGNGCYVVAGSFKHILPVLKQALPKDDILGLSGGVIPVSSRFDLARKMSAYLDKEGLGCKTNVFVFFRLSPEQFELASPLIEDVNTPKKRAVKKASKPFTPSEPRHVVETGPVNLKKMYVSQVPLPVKSVSEGPFELYRKKFTPISKSDVQMEQISKINEVLDNWELYLGKKGPSKYRTTQHADSVSFFCKAERLSKVLGVSSGIERKSRKGMRSVKRTLKDAEQFEKFIDTLVEYKQLCHSVTAYCCDDDYRETFDALHLRLCGEYVFSAKDSRLLAKAEQHGMLFLNDTSVGLSPITILMVELQLKKPVSGDLDTDAYRVQQLKRFCKLREENPNVVLPYHSHDF